MVKYTDVLAYTVRVDSYMHGNLYIFKLLAQLARCEVRLERRCYNVLQCELLVEVRQHLRAACSCSHGSTSTIGAVTLTVKAAPSDQLELRVIAAPSGQLLSSTLTEIRWQQLQSAPIPSVLRHKVGLVQVDLLFSTEDFNKRS